MIQYGDTCLYLPHLFSNVEIIFNQMLHLICNINKNLIHTEEKPYDKSVHTGEEPYIYDFMIVSLINKPRSQNQTMSNLLVKINYFGRSELFASKVLLI